MRVRHPGALALCLGVSVFAILAPDTGRCTEHEDPYADARRQLVRTIEEHVRQTSAYLGKSELDPRVIAAMETVPRHEFVPETLRSLAYADKPLPIGNDQTISQPYIVAIMTDLLDLPPNCKVLDIGTGSGYQAAVLAALGAQVFTIEIVSELAARAQKDFERLGIKNVTAREGDGYAGWREHGPFDAIVVTAAPPHVPPALLDQLAEGGRLVIPVGGAEQHLQVITRGPEDFEVDVVEAVNFVPLRSGTVR